MEFQRHNGLLIPVGVKAAPLPDWIGLGCPKCDDHDLKPFAAGDDPATLMAAFLRRHASCGRLDTLEKRGGELVVTGYLDGPTS